MLKDLWKEFRGMIAAELLYWSIRVDPGPAKALHKALQDGKKL